MDGSRYNEGSGARFSLGLIVGDPFALATISIAIVSPTRALYWDWTSNAD
jgi:hypothetical protein